MLPLLAGSLILRLVSISGKLWAKKLLPKMRNESIITSFCSAISSLVSCLFCEKLEAGVWNQGTFRIPFCVLLTSYVEIILESTISRVFSYPDIGVIFEKYILSRSHKLAGVEPTGALDSCSGTQNEQKNTQNNLIEVEMRTLSM